MLIFKKHNLLNSYHWPPSPEEITDFMRYPPDSIFNKKNGYQVLYTINKFLDKANKPDVYDGEKAERLIFEKLPDSAFTHAEIWQWLKANWKDNLIIS